LNIKAIKALGRLFSKFCFWFGLLFGVCWVVVVRVRKPFPTWLLAKKHWLLGIHHVACWWDGVVRVYAVISEQLGLLCKMKILVVIFYIFVIV